MTRLDVTWEYDQDDDTQRTASSEAFFAAWVNQFGVIEWTCTDEATFEDLVASMER